MTKSRSKKNEAPLITVRMNARGALEPVTAYDAEMLSQAKAGKVFDLVAASERSLPHHKLYWSILGKACKATGKWPTSAHLHRELKMACGYYQTVASEFGGIYYLPDSISFHHMDQEQFNTFFEATMQKLAEAIGLDPLELLNEIHP